MILSCEKRKIHLKEHLLHIKKLESREQKQIIDFPCVLVVLATHISPQPTTVLCEAQRPFPCLPVCETLRKKAWQ